MQGLKVIHVGKKGPGDNASIAERVNNCIVHS